MSTIKIPAKKEMKPGMRLNDTDYIWDYLDSYVEEEEPAMFDDDIDYAFEEDYDWEPDYRDAFEDDPEACWGREW